MVLQLRRLLGCGNKIRTAQLSVVFFFFISLDDLLISVTQSIFHEKVFFFSMNTLTFLHKLYGSAHNDAIFSGSNILA